ncbi:hypothetical protein EV127DRAFT_152138 [Xylaria flabelliformis]|nr:hypothetical protein EV127DRAFT_152138 [Xylaria flabelliformis]
MNGYQRDLRLHHRCCVCLHYTRQRAMGAKKRADRDGGGFFPIGCDVSREICHRARGKRAAAHMTTTCHQKAKQSGFLSPDKWWMQRGCYHVPLPFFPSRGRCRIGGRVMHSRPNGNKSVGDGDGEGCHSSVPLVLRIFHRTIHSSIQYMLPSVYAIPLHFSLMCNAGGMYPRNTTFLRSQTMCGSCRRPLSLQNSQPAGETMQDKAEARKPPYCRCREAVI